MSFAFSLAAAVLALALSGPVPLTAADVAARHVAAIGGFARVRALTSIAYTGVYRESGVALAASQTFMRPYYEVIDPHLQPAITEGFDGRPWEFYSQFGVVLRTSGAPGMATTHASEFDDSLANYAAKGSRITLDGERTIHGRTAFDVLVTLGDGFAKHLYVDEQTFLIMASRQTAKVHAFGDRVTSQSLIGGYRRVAGVLVPTTFREVDLATGRELNRLTWTAVVTNRPFPVAQFSPPRFTRSPLSALLEDLYAHRDDSAHDAAAYRTFRRRFAGANIESGIEFIGYQILKTGVSASAIALLAANVHDHQHSADALFGLGRAYRVAGRERLAVAAFRSALRFNPRDARARQALQNS
jgi:hypothetical protein